MNEEQLKQLVGEVSQAIQQGANPEEILQQLVQAGVPQETATQIIQAAMQGGEMNTGMGSMQTERESQGVIEAALSELGPEVLLALLSAFMKLSDQNKQALVGQLSQMANQSSNPGSAAMSGSGSQEAESQTNVAEKNVFGMS